MKAKELKELGVEELKAKLAEQRQELFNLRFQHTTAQLEKTSSIPAARKPKFSSRAYNRCPICGRPHAYMRKFGLCRICFRNMALRGDLPGVRKSSW